MNDRLKRKVVLITVLTVAAVVIGAVIYILRTESPKAELPIRHIGDEWTYKVTEDNVYVFHHRLLSRGR